MNTITSPTRADRVSLIFVRCFLDRTRAAQTLRHLRDRRKNKWTLEADALLDAAIVLENEADSHAKEALRRGQLLFCHPDTTALEGGAA